MRYVINHANLASDVEWQIQRTADELPDLFRRGACVRHLNPRYRSWRGTVQPTVGGAGRHLYTTDPRYLAVHVVWHAGVTPGGKVPASGWFAAAVLIPDPGGNPADAMPPALPAGPADEQGTEA